MKIASPDFAAPSAPCRRIRRSRRRVHPAAVDACITRQWMRATDNLREKRVKMHFICG